MSTDSNPGSDDDRDALPAVEHVAGYTEHDDEAPRERPSWASDVIAKKSNLRGGITVVSIQSKYYPERRNIASTVAYPLDKCR